MKINNDLKFFWGDLHSHCSISYGEGNLENAIKRASQQLDFCSITGHAFWPDINKLSNKQKDIKKYHIDGFKKLKKNWNNILIKLRLFEIKYSACLSTAVRLMPPGFTAELSDEISICKPSILICDS